MEWILNHSPCTLGYQSDVLLILSSTPGITKSLILSKIKTHRLAYEVP